MKKGAKEEATEKMDEQSALDNGKTRLCGELGSNEAEANVPSNPDVSQNSLFDSTLKDLRSFHLPMGDSELDIVEILVETWAELAEGKVDYEFSAILHNKCRLPNNTQLLETARAVLAQLRLSNVVQIGKK